MFFLLRLLCAKKICLRACGEVKCYDRALVQFCLLLRWWDSGFAFISQVGLTVPSIVSNHLTHTNSIQYSFQKKEIKCCSSPAQTETAHKLHFVPVKFQSYAAISTCEEETLSMLHQGQQILLQLQRTDVFQILIRFFTPFQT